MNTLRCGQFVLIPEQRSWHLAIMMAQLSCTALVAMDGQCCVVSNRIQKQFVRCVFYLLETYQTPMLISASEDTTLKSIDTTSGQVLSSFEGHGNYVGAVVASPQHGIFSGSYDGSIIHWSAAADGRMMKKLDRAHDGYNVECLAMFESLLASGGGDGSIRFWSLPHLTLVNNIKVTDDVYAICFHPSGTWLASGGSDRQIKLWSE
jgi:WD40 repeat protein